MNSVMNIFLAICSMFLDVYLFWYRKLLGRWYSKTPVNESLARLHGAETFAEWEEAALQLDDLKVLNLWRNDPSSRSYDWMLINDRLDSIAIAREENDLQSLIDLVRAGLVRNLGNITAPRLYNRSFAGTKILIEEYIAQVVGAVEDIEARTSTPIHDRYTHYALSTQRRLDFLHDSRQAFGRTTLVLQGGAIFGLCHLGVVKALFLQGLLPRIITGTATGALIASLVAIHNEEELLGVLQGDGIDLSAFETHEQKVHDHHKWQMSYGNLLGTLIRRVSRFWVKGYFLDVKILEECVKANVGDMTFEEAYNKSKRVLNITVASEKQDGVPTLLNYITAPNVLIWTAAVASNASTPSLYGRRQTTMLCKDIDGNIVPWATSADPTRAYTYTSQYSDKDSSSSGSSAYISTNNSNAPLSRIAQLFNVNHFIVSQARPYLIPFLQSDMHGPSLYSAPAHRRAQLQASLVRVAGLELRHRLRQLDTLGLLTPAVRRFLVDEELPHGHLYHHGAAATSMLLVPPVTMGDFGRLLETPTRQGLEHWVRLGEQSVWPAVCALRVRCAIEYGIESAYQRARTLKAGGLRRKGSTAGGPGPGSGGHGGSNNGGKNVTTTGSSGGAGGMNSMIPAIATTTTTGEAGRGRERSEATDFKGSAFPHGRDPWG